MQGIFVFSPDTLKAFSTNQVAYTWSPHGPRALKPQPWRRKYYKYLQEKFSDWPLSGEPYPRTLELLIAPRCFDELSPRAYGVMVMK